MAVLQRIRELFVPEVIEEPEIIIPVPETDYFLRRLTEDHLKEVLLLNLRCFRRGENYTKYTFKYLLTAPNILSYKAVDQSGRMVGFIFIVANNDHVAHITTIGVAPEHRNRGVGGKLLMHAEKAISARAFESVVLEVRVNNFAAQNLYSRAGYSIIQRLIKYYNNGEDAYLMSKSFR